mgnify:CR=1 FL=1
MNIGRNNMEIYIVFYKNKIHDFHSWGAAALI